MELPDKKYKIIYADPPWSYKDSRKGHRLGATTHYDTMTLDDICELPVQDIADKDCILFMWATSPFLPEAFKVLKAWGFKYKTVAFVWSKRTKHGKPFFNLGGWTMGNVEVCLLATKGRPKRIRKDMKQLVLAQLRGHSRKPQEVPDRIVELMGDIPRIELFARDRKGGWDAWGNQITEPQGSNKKE